MKRKFNVKVTTVAAGLALSLSMLVTACGQSGTNPNNTAGQSSNSPSASTSNSTISGSITAVGSSALQPLAEQAAQQFMAKNTKARIQVQGGGSGTGLTQVSQGGADIGNSDLFAEEKLPADKAKELVDHKVAVVGFATIVNPKVTVDNLTKQQVIDIFTGKITNWKDIGGNDMPVVLISRPSSSGTRGTFKKYALDGKEEAAGKSMTEDSSGTIRKTVAETDGAISYLALSYVDKSVKALKYDGVAATVENVKNGTYPIWSYEHMYTKGEATGLAKAFLDYMVSSEVSKIVIDGGYIPLSEMKTSRDK